MTRDELISALRQRKKVLYKYTNTEYLAVGYKLLVTDRGETTYQAGIKDLHCNSYIWCGLNEVELIGD